MSETSGVGEQQQQQQRERKQQEPTTTTTTRKQKWNKRDVVIVALSFLFLLISFLVGAPFFRSSTSTTYTRTVKPMPPRSIPTNTTPPEIILTATSEQSIYQCNQIDNVPILVNLKATSFDASYRAPLDLVTVIDRSGSMSGKMELVQKTLRFIVRQLNSQDRLSIVIYDHEVSVLLPLTSMDASGKEQAENNIKQISPRGSTNLCGGLMLGLDVMMDRSIKNEVASLMLFTDGLANEGVYTLDGIVTEIANKGNLPCSVHTFGFGSDHDVNILKSIAERGDGTYFFVQNEEAIGSAFANCLGGLLSVIAQNIVVELQGVNGAVVKQVRTSYPTVDSQTHHTIKIGDIQSEEERDLFLMVSLPSVPGPSVESTPVLQAKVSYLNVITSKQEEKTCQCYVSRNDDLTNSVTDLKVDLQRNRLNVAEILEKAKTMADKGQYKEAQIELENEKETIEKSKTANDPYVMVLLKDMEDVHEGLENEEAYQKRGSFKASSYLSSHQQQRATHQSDSYQTSSRSLYENAYVNDEN